MQPQPKSRPVEANALVGNICGELQQQRACAEEQLLLTVDLSMSSFVCRAVPIVPFLWPDTPLPRVRQNQNMDLCLVFPPSTPSQHSDNELGIGPRRQNDRKRLGQLEQGGGLGWGMGLSVTFPFVFGVLHN